MSKLQEQIEDLRARIAREEPRKKDRADVKYLAGLKNELRDLLAKLPDENT